MPNRQRGEVKIQSYSVPTSALSVEILIVLIQIGLVEDRERISVGVKSSDHDGQGIVEYNKFII